jgi:hypothetical protein
MYSRDQDSAPVPAGAGEFSYQATARFARKLEDLSRMDPAGHRRVTEVINRVLERPQENDGQLHGIHQGRLKKYVGRSGWRLVYDWCRACRKANRRQSLACELCGIIPDNSVIFFDLFHKNEAARLGY